MSSPAPKPPALPREGARKGCLGATAPNQGSVDLVGAQDASAAELVPLVSLDDPEDRVHQHKLGISQDGAPTPLTGTRQFRRWFNHSAVVDEQGEPLRVFHGTNRVFHAFDPEQSREDGDIFFARSPEVASNFALYRSTWGGASVLPVYLAATNLLVVDCDFRMIREFERNFTADGIHYGDDLRAHAKRHGYQGIIYRNALDDVGPDMPKADDLIVLFSPNPAQIKSAFNCGDFDPNNPDVRA